MPRDEFDDDLLADELMDLDWNYHEKKEWNAKVATKTEIAREEDDGE